MQEVDVRVAPRMELIPNAEVLQRVSQSQGIVKGLLLLEEIVELATGGFLHHKFIVRLLVFRIVGRQSGDRAICAPSRFELQCLRMIPVRLQPGTGYSPRGLGALLVGYTFLKVGPLDLN